MATIKLAHIQRYTDRHGKLRHYYRRPGHKRAPLPGEPGSAEFMEAYQAAAASPALTAGTAPTAGTIAALIVAYYQSQGFKVLQAATQANYRRILDRFRGEHGDKRAALLQPKHMLAILDKMGDRPEAARNLLKRLRTVFGFGVERGLVPSNPIIGVKAAKRKSGGFRPWTDADIEQFEAYWPSGSKPRLALYILLHTTQRRSDAVRLGKQHRRGDTVRYRPKKDGAGADELIIQIHPDLKAELDLLPKDQLTFIMTEYGKPYSPAGFSNWFSEAAKRAGLPPNSSPHGLRKAGSRRLAEAGATANEIGSVTGHRTLKEVERYTRSAEQQRLAEAAMTKLTDKG